MTPIEEIAVIIPARDEAALISRSLLSVERAREAAIRRLGEAAPTVRIIVVADGCRDESAQIARKSPFVEVLEIEPSGVAMARRLGVEHALSTSVTVVEGIWLAHTDADSAVYSDWLIDQLECAAGGADVFIGAVRPNFNDLSPAQARAWRGSHRGNQARGHVHGANLGIRASSYLAVDGFPLLEVGEDVAITERARSAGAIVTTNDRTVLTSGRLQSRVTGGYADYLTAMPL